MLHQLIHKGVIVPDPPEYQGLAIGIEGKSVRLTPKQEEMAYAWAKKKGTPYADDLVFMRNFLRDFSAALGYPPLKINQIDFSQLDKRVEEEKAAREALSKEERKALARERKKQREERKQEYGYAIADGERIELGNYMTEPSGIFMGRGKHPLRGRWKEGATKSDVTLNLSPEAEINRQEWKEVIWQPESLWVARWEDKLSGKQKYLWLHDSAPIKQSREAQKFDKAIELDEKLALVREHIERGLVSDDAKIRRIATACCLIDELCLRVGDEKDPDEADTVGATTLRPEHIKIHTDVVEFRFLGKDSVLWHKKIALPQRVIANLQELVENARPSSASAKKHSVYNRPQLFPDVSSRNVNAFLSQVMPGLTAKVFRTHHASQVVRDNLDAAAISRHDPEYKKWEAATQANTQAAILCNHTRQAPKNWGERKRRYKEREKSAAENVKKIAELAKEHKSTLNNVKKEFAEKKKRCRDRAQAKKLAVRYTQKIDALKERIENAAGREARAQAALGRLRAQMAIAMENRTWNLVTSQKSYIDPRIFYNWGNRVDYDVLEKYYSKTLRVKFQWVKNNDLTAEAAEREPGMHEELELNDFCARARIADVLRDEIVDLHEKYGPTTFYHTRLTLGEQHFAQWRVRLYGETQRRGEVVLFIRNRQDAILLHTKSFYPPDAYRIPTGGIRADESAIDALERELAEETSLRAVSSRLLALLLYEFRCQEQTALFLSYIFDIAVDDGAPRAQDEGENISDFRWILPAQLPAVIEQLQQLPGQWQEWGALRAVPHQIILSALDGEEEEIKDTVQSF